MAGVPATTPPPARFISLRWKTLFASTLFLLLLNASFSALLYLSLSDQFERQREDEFRKYTRHLDGILEQSFQSLLQTGDLFPLLAGMDQALLKGDAAEVQRVFAGLWGDMQLHLDIDVAALYSPTGAPLAGRHNDPLSDCPDASLKGYVERVNASERPLTLLDCTGLCRQYVLSPLLVEGRHVGVVLVGGSVAGLTLGFREVGGADLAILNTASACGPGHQDPERTLGAWKAQVLAVTSPATNLPLLRAAAERFPNPAQLRAGLRVEHSGHVFELRLLPFPEVLRLGAGHLLVIDDVTGHVERIDSAIRHSILIGVTGLILSTLLVLAIQWRPLVRLHATSQALPLIAESAFDRVRRTVARYSRRRGPRDELDTLGESMLLAADRLESLQCSDAENRRALDERMEELGRERDFVAHLLDTAQVVVCTLDRELRLLSINQLGEQISGCTEEKLLGHDFAETLVNVEPDPELAHRLHGLFDTQDGVLRHEAQLRGRDGGLHHVTWLHSTVQNRSGDSRILLSVGLDITERKKAELRLAWLADHDPLTGMLNRRRFLQELQKAVAQARRYGHTGALLFLDLDNFKYINDTHGHGAGDRLLQQVARTLERRLRSSDTLARLGGDELAVILPEGGAEEALAIAGDIVRAQAKAGVVAGRGQKLQATVSVGIALFPGHADEARDLLSFADAAMLAAKRAGGSQAHLFEPDRDARTQVQRQRFWQDRIRQGLSRGGFELHFQPIAEVNSLRVSHFETLLRIRNPDGKLSGPQELIKAAERSGQILEIDQFVLEQALQRLAAAVAAGRDLRLSVNVSGPSLQDLTLARRIEQLLHKTGVEPRRIVLEVTETAAVSDIYTASRLMEEVMGLGCLFALDDFGAGFSSFYYLRELPIQFVKLDGSFIRNLPERADDQAVVRALTEIAKGFGKHTIAEFVENAATLELLRGYGVDYAQGYFIGRPSAQLTPGDTGAPEVAAG